MFRTKVKTVDSDTKTEVGRMLKQRRMAVPMTLQELARATGVSASHLGRIERSERFPSARVLRRLAQPLGFDEAELLTVVGFLSPKPDPQHADRRVDQMRLDPYVAAMLAEEPIGIQRAVIGILSVMKSMVRGMNGE